jgi:hypothetical protein
VPGANESFAPHPVQGKVLTNAVSGRVGWSAACSID